MELTLSEPSTSSPCGGSQKSGNAHRASVGGVQRGGSVRGGLGHEHQVEVWGVGGVQKNLPQHGAREAHRLRRSAGGWTDTEKIIQPADPVFMQRVLFMMQHHP